VSIHTNNTGQLKSPQGGTKIHDKDELVSIITDEWRETRTKEYM